MKHGLEAMDTALRVLTAITQGRNPDPADIEALRKYDESANGRDFDQLACDVIQKAIKRRAALRRAG